MKLVNVEDLKVLVAVESKGEIRYGKLVTDLFDDISTVEAIPIEQLISILPKYDDYIHLKTYPYNETMEDIYSKGYEDGWNVCLKIIKDELDYWEKENESRDTESTK